MSETDKIKINRVSSKKQPTDSEKSGAVVVKHVKKATPKDGMSPRASVTSSGVKKQKPPMRIKLEDSSLDNAANVPEKMVKRRVGNVARSESLQGNEASRNSEVQVETENREKEPVKLRSKDWIKQNKLKFGVILGAVILAIVAVIVGLIIWKNNGEDEKVPEVDNAETASDVDFAQKVTAEDGGKFEAQYELGSEKDFVVRFAELKCEDNCTNVRKVKIGKKVLTAGKDYEIKQGSIIVVVFAETMEKLYTGSQELVVELIMGGETLLVGVKFEVKPDETACADGETREDGVCVKDETKDEAEEVADDVGNASSSNSISKPDTNNGSSNQGSQSQVSAEQAACERRAGPTAVIEVVYLTAEQKQAWVEELGYPDDIVALVMQSSFQGTTKMVWRDGRCQPSYNGAVLAGGMNQPYNTSKLPAQAQVYSGQNAVIWIWADGSEEIELVGDPYSYLYNHF